MVCSHCGIAGHTYRRCPTITPEEKKAKEEEIKKEKEERAQRRNARNARRHAMNLHLHAAFQNMNGVNQQNQPTPPLEPPPPHENQIQNQEVQEDTTLNDYKKYNIVNTIEHGLVAYWSNAGTGILRRLCYIDAHNTTNFRCKDDTEIIIIPFVEVSDGGSVNAKRCIYKNSLGEIEETTLFNQLMGDYDGTHIIIDTQYNPPKNELDQWKECALKSRFLLDQIYKMTGGKKTLSQYENIEPFIDMIQDVKIPNSCTEIDKEVAGVPSTLTNIT